jgi:Bacteriophage minor capsid protein
VEITKQIALFLARSGFGNFDEAGTSGNIFIQTIPDQPDVALAIFSHGGPGNDPMDEYIRINFQIIIRTIPNDPRAGEVLAQQIVDALNGFNSDYLTAGGNWVFDTSALQSGPNNIGRDQKNRFEYSQNFMIEYKK